MGKKLVSKTLILVMALTILLSVPTTVFAEIKDTDETVKITINVSDVPDITQAIKETQDALGVESLTGTNVLVDSDASSKDTAALTLFSYTDTAKLIFNVDAFNDGKKKQVKKAMSAFVNALKDSSISSDTQQDIMTEIQESDEDVSAMMLLLIFDNTKADIFTAYKWLYPFMQVVRVLFGIGAVIIILFAVASTILDLCYIGLPVWREAATEKNGNKKPFGISYEALSTVQEVEKNLGEYQNAYIMYGKRRAITYVVLAISILYLVAGELSGLIGWVLNLASGVVQ